jgi:ParB family chromosome partitioning protein
VPKSVTLAALADIGGSALAGRYAGAKKAELAQSCERIFSGDFIAEVEVKEAAQAWVPEVMRFAPPAPPFAETDENPSAPEELASGCEGEAGEPALESVEEAA